MKRVHGEIDYIGGEVESLALVHEDVIATRNQIKLTLVLRGSRSSSSGHLTLGGELVLLGEIGEELLLFFLELHTELRGMHRNKPGSVATTTRPVANHPSEIRNRAEARSVTAHVLCLGDEDLVPGLSKQVFRHRGELTQLS